MNRYGSSQSNMFSLKQLRDIACKEFIDVLFRCLPSIDCRTTCARSAAASFLLPADAIADWVISEKPLIHIDSASLCIGRLVLPIPHPAPPSTAKQLKQTSPFCHTALALRLMEASCACVQQNEPVLLTGETGELKQRASSGIKCSSVQIIFQTHLNSRR
jgi:midasin (ATPase involved in ribosome maturation)